MKRKFGEFILTLAGLIAISSCAGAPPIAPVSLAPAEAVLPAVQAAPVILSPKDHWLAGEALMVSIAVFPGAGVYRIEAAADESFAPLLEAASVPADAAEGSEGPVRAFLSLPLEPGQKIHLRVKAILAAGTETAWEKWAVAVQLATPKALAPEITPAAAKSRLPVFSWTSVPKASGYEAQIAPAGESETPLQSVEVVDPGRSSFVPPRPLPSAGRYLFRVRALSPAGPGNWSPSVSFELPVLRPRLLAPTAEERLTSTRPLFRWQPGEEEGRLYHLEIAALVAGDGKPVRRFADIPGWAYRPPEDLPRGARYQARVLPSVAPAPAGDSSWSDPVRFEVLSNRQDPFPIKPFAAQSSLHETMPSVSRDGLRLAYLARPLEEARTGAGQIRQLERVLGSSAAEPEFRPLPIGAFSSNFRKGERLQHCAWGAGAEGQPVLWAAAAPSLRTAGMIFQLEAWNDTPIEVSPPEIQGAIARLSVPASAAKARLYFEVRSGSSETGNGAGPAAAEEIRLLPATFSASSFPANLLEEEMDKNRREIWSMNPDGTNLRLLALGWDPSISPDGKTLVYAAAGEEGPEMHLLFLNSGGSGTTKVFPSQRRPALGIRGPTWSPRGDAIIFARDQGDGFDLVLIEVATGLETAITQSYGNDVDPIFLADPSRNSGYWGILFSSDRDGKSWNLYWAEVR